MRRGVVKVVVDAEHDGEVRLLGGRGDDDLLRAACQVLGGYPRRPSGAWVFRCRGDVYGDGGLPRSSSWMTPGRRSFVIHTICPMCSALWCVT